MTNLEELILVAEYCPVSKSQIPPFENDRKSIARIGYEILIEEPYKYTESEFFHELHFVRRNRPDLINKTYNIKLSLLVTMYGWGVHSNKQGKLALIPMESDEYKLLKTMHQFANEYKSNKVSMRHR
jgi:hypothetical protein